MTQTALITGGQRGIGLGIARALKEAGFQLALIAECDPQHADVIAALDELGTQARYVQHDLRKVEDAPAVLDIVEAELGPVSTFISNAGVPARVRGDMLDIQADNFDFTLDVNLKGAYLMSKYAVPRMVGQGSGNIIHNGSGWGVEGGAAAAAYCASKGGIVLLTRAMAIDHGRDGIRVNCVSPGDVETPMLTDDARNRNITWEDYRDEASQRPMGRIGTPDEIARATLFLASDDSSYMTGANLIVDGGGVA